MGRRIIYPLTEKEIEKIREAYDGKKGTLARIAEKLHPDYPLLVFWRVVRSNENYRPVERRGVKNQRPNRRRGLVVKRRKRMRLCLGCGNLFPSDGPGNRICKHCKERRRFWKLDPGIFSGNFTNAIYQPAVSEDFGRTLKGLTSEV